MAPTLNPLADETGRVDWVFMRPYIERSSRWRASKDASEAYDWGLKRGDVIVFWKPHKPEEIGIKRVVATEGDTVYPVRGYALDQKSYQARFQGLPDGFVDDDPDSVAESELGKVVVPYGHVWVEGDNWRKSWDSNDFGPISKGLIIGKAFRVWRNWFGFEPVGDERLKSDAKRRSKVIEGHGQIPVVFLE